jgi:hypothetical protein
MIEKNSGIFEIFKLPKEYTYVHQKKIKNHHYPTYLALLKNPDSRKFWAFWNFYAA